MAVSGLDTTKYDCRTLDGAKAIDYAASLFLVREIDMILAHSKTSLIESVGFLQRETQVKRQRR